MIKIAESLSSLSSSTFSLLHLLPVELESSHVFREDEGFLPRGGVIQPT